MTSNVATRTSRVLAGKCTVCLRRKRTAGYSTCTPCRRAIAEYGADRYATRRAAGICAQCDADASGYLCEVHAEARRIRRRQT